MVDGYGLVLGGSEQVDVGYVEQVGFGNVEGVYQLVGDFYVVVFGLCIVQYDFEFGEIVEVFYCIDMNVCLVGEIQLVYFDDMVGCVDGGGQCVVQCVGCVGWNDVVV